MATSREIPSSHFQRSLESLESQGLGHPPTQKDVMYSHAETLPASQEEEEEDDESEEESSSSEEEGEENVVYCPELMKEPLDDWLMDNKPSMLRRSDNIGWICIQRLSGKFMIKVDKIYKQKDVPGLLDAWERVQKSGDTIDKEKVFNLAEEYGVTRGKWMFQVETGYKVDYLWSVVAKAMVNTNLAFYAKVSAHDDITHQRPHVCCIYNLDFTNEEEVFALEQKIRAIGIRRFINYKPDVYTYLGIYRNNKWKMRPTIYESRYDALKKQSKLNTL